MGRMWDALRRGCNVPSQSESSRATANEDAEPMLVEPEEIPFIEVGPRKSVEASPSVLAYEEKKDKGGAKRQDTRLSSSEATAPRRVPFRAVFLAAADTEAETP
jgi:hypothetical protein